MRATSAPKANGRMGTRGATLPPAMRTLYAFVKTTVVGGLLFLVPFILLFVVVEKAFVIAHRVIAPVAHHFPAEPVAGVSVASLAALLLVLVASFGAGLAARTAAGRDIAAWIERTVLTRLPGYVLLKGMVDDLGQFDALHASVRTEAVFVRIEDAWQIGFLTDRLASGELAVFVPGAPSPMSGSLYFLTPDRVRPSGLTVHDATALLRRIGLESA